MPNFEYTKESVTVFVAGPAMRKINAAPGEKPFAINAVAIGIDPVAHTYNGIAITNTSKIF